jgi:hypothetical protein
MAEYIEREAALDAISEWLMKALHTENMSSYNEGERAAYRTALSEVAELPAADVRPVVRCAECRHRDPEDHKCDCGQLERAGCVFPVDDDYYCAYGER